MIRLAATFALALAAPVVAPLAAGAADEPSSELIELQRRDARLFHAGWRLVTGNARFCKDAAPAIGLLLHDANAYGERETVRAALGLSGDIAVQAVAPESPAAAAGLAVNDTLREMAGRQIARAFPRSDPRWQRVVDVKAALDAALEVGPVELAWSGLDGRVHAARVAGVPACRSRFEVLDEGDDAVAEGTRVIFGRDFPAFAYPEDEFAAAVAHELAHNLLDHRELLDAQGRERALVRLTERDADRLMPWLLHNAGYDPRAAVRFMQRWGPRHGGGIFRKRTHDGWDERVEFIEAEIARLDDVIAEHGAADWSRHFVRQADGWSGG